MTHGLYRQIWDLSNRNPCAEIRLDKMLQWVSLTRRWHAMRPPPTPAKAKILKDLLRSHHSVAHSDEWGTHPNALQEVGACALIPDTCMCLQITLQPSHATLQACVDAWGDLPSRA